MENCGIRPASVQVSQQQGGQRQMVYLCTQCARQLGMIGSGPEGGNPFEMLQYLVQQQSQGPGNFFEALSGEARESVMRAREVSAGTTPTAAIGTDHLLAGVVSGDNTTGRGLRRAARRGLDRPLQRHRGDRAIRVYTVPQAPSERCSSLSWPRGRWLGPCRERALASACSRGRQRLPDLPATGLATRTLERDIDVSCNSAARWGRLLRPAVPVAVEASVPAVLEARPGRRWLLVRVVVRGSADRPYPGSGHSDLPRPARNGGLTP